MRGNVTAVLGVERLQRTYEPGRASLAQGCTQTRQAALSDLSSNQAFRSHHIYPFGTHPNERWEWGVQMNEFTRDALWEAFRKNKNLYTKRFDLIVFAASCSYWDNLHGTISYQFVNRAIRLYYQFAPECVTEDGLENNYIDCDYCAQMVSDRITEFMEWWIRQHPEYSWTEFIQEEVQMEYEIFTWAELAEQNRGKMLQLAFL